jgi:hypothetical protein
MNQASSCIRTTGQLLVWSSFRGEVGTSTNGALDSSAWCKAEEELQANDHRRLLQQ